jgi:2-phospho-L-lactate guanylyltransferase
MVWALLPVKDLVRAKSRLAGTLAPHERRALAQAMLEDVLSALVAAEGLQGVLLLSDDPSAELLAHKYAIEVVSESALGCRGLNGAVAAGRDLLASRGVRDMMVVHSDIPLLQAAHIEQLLARYAGPAIDVLIVPDDAGDGTNLMLCGVGSGLEFCYGPGSCRAHQASARRRGLAVEVLPLPGVGLDIDEPADLLELYKYLQAGERGRHTAALLLAGDIGPRLELMDHNGLGDARRPGKHDAI